MSNKIEINKTKDGVEITNIISNNSTNALLALMKIKCNITLLFKRNFEIISQITLKERLSKNNKLFISIILDGKQQIISYEDLFGIIKEKLKIGIISVIIDKKDYIQKEPLFLMVDNFNPKLIASCVLLDYDIKNKVYLLLNRPSKEGLSDKLYYYEENNSILGFSDNGPVLIYGKTTSVEDIFCQ